MTENKQTKQVSTIKEIKESQESGLTYKITAYVTRIYRTEGGLNIFTISDGNETFKLISFAKGGISYGDVNEGAIVNFELKRRSYENELQGTIIDAVVSPIGYKTRQLKKQLLLSQYKAFMPQSEMIISTMDFEKLLPSIKEAAQLIRGAINTGRPILLTHHGDTDGFSGAIILERAIKGLLNKQHPDLRFVQNYYVRNPSKTPYYSVSDATRDIAFFELNNQRTKAPAPLVIILDNGSTKQDLLAIKKVSLFDADVIVVDHHDPGEKDDDGKTIICKEVMTHVNPHLHGLSKNISASMLAFELANQINPEIKPSAHLAALGGVSDWCEGNEIEQLLKLAKEKRNFLKELSYLVDYEIHQQKFFHQTGSLFQLLDGPKQKDLIDLYTPIMKDEKEKVRLAINEYSNEETLGKFKLFSIESDDIAFWNDYFTSGKIAAILHEEHEDVNLRVSLVLMSNMGVFRVSQEEKTGFDVNEIIKKLQKDLPFARVSGGGHDVAGSIRFVAASKEKVLAKIKEYISTKK